MNLFTSRSQAIKKKRKSRTAFTNHQIFELEKRFLYQKYLSPADRDEIALSLGLTNAQVITWFQNRRAKLKRDVEELKKDCDAAKLAVAMPHSHTLLDNIQDLTLLKKPELMAALHHHHQATAVAAAAAAAAAAQHQAQAHAQALNSQAAAAAAAAVKFEV